MRNDRVTLVSCSAAASTIVLLLASWAPCHADTASVADSGPRTFYVDSSGGNDGAPGLAPDQAWKTLTRVNSADLKPGDTVRLRRGGVWRGSLVPASGEEGAPVTYTTYGDGAKPLLLGSLPRHRLEDWVQVDGDLWATLPMEFVLGGQVLDLRRGSWSHHQEQGASVCLTQENTPAGTLVQMTCATSGSASNHIQVWGPDLPVEKGTHLQFTFRARCSKPLAMPPMSIRKSGSPWTPYATSARLECEVGPDWEAFRVVFRVTESSEAGRLHILLGGLLPAGAVFEFQPERVHPATANISDPLAVDVGNIIFDHGEKCGWKKWSKEDLENPYDYFYDGASQRVFLNCPANPASLHESIELAMKGHVVNQGGKHHVVYDGLAVMYGASHGFGGGGTHHLVIRNCDLGYIGGAHQLTRADGRPVRFGNAIEFWGAAHDNLVEGCRIWEVYDAALTNQGRDPSSNQVNITYRNNFIRNAEYSFEYWNHPETALTKNIRFVNNTCIDAGTVWSHAQRPDRNGSHLMFYSNTAETSGIEIKYNVFCNHTEWGSRYSSGWKTLPDIDHNLWHSDSGVMAYWFREKIGSFAEYQKTTGLDRHSLFAKPQFVDAAGGDHRLAPDSPGANLGPEGRPAGADAAWIDAATGLHQPESDE
jgi:hypothetical protein